MAKRTHLSVDSLEQRWNPATFTYAAGTLTVVPDEGTLATITPSNNAPAGYIEVTDGNTNFSSLNNDEIVTNVVINLSNRNNSGALLDNTAVITGSLTILGSKGLTIYDHQGTIGKDLNIIPGATTGVQLQISQFSAIGRHANIKTGTGGGFVNLRGGTIGGNFNFTGSSNVDTVQLNDLSQVSIGGSATFKLAGGNNAFNSVDTGTLKIGKNLTVLAGNGTDTINLDNGFGSALDVGGNVLFSLGSGFNATTLSEGWVGGNLSIIGAGAADQISLTATGDMTVAGNATFTLAEGEGVVQSSGTGVFTVGKNFTTTMGSQDDEFDMVTGTTTTLKVGGKMSVNLGSATTGNVYQTDVVDVGGTLTVLGGNGGDTVNMIGSNLIGGAITLKLGNGSNTTTLFGGNLGGVNYTGGTGLDTTIVDQVQVFGNMNLNLGPVDFGIQHAWIGTDDFVPSAIFGNLSIKTTTGEANIAVRRADVIGNMTIATGTGNDILNFDDANVGGATAITTGAGLDTIALDNLSIDGVGNLNNTTTFGGKVKIDAGSGNDIVHLSDIGGTMIRFGSTLTLIGGAGQDTYGNTVFNEFFVTGNKALTTEVVNGPAIPA